MVNLLQLDQSVNTEDFVEGPFGMGPRAKLADVQKAEQLYDINVDEFMQRGIADVDSINQTLARFIAIDRAEKDGITDSSQLNNIANTAQKKYIDMVAKNQLDPDVFFYKYTNVAPKKGPLSRFTEFALRGGLKAAAEIMPPLYAAKTAAQITPYPPAKPFASALGFSGTLLTTLGTGLGEGLVKAGEDLGIFESRPLPPADRPSAKAGEVFGYDLALALNAKNLPRATANTFSGLLTSRSLMSKKNKFPSLLNIPYKTSRFLEKTITDIGATARGEKGKLAKSLFLAGEIPTITGAAVGAGLAEQFDPSDDMTATLSEVGGGTLGAFTPSNMVLKLVPTFLRTVDSGSTAETRLAMRITDMIENRSQGETVDEIITNLENNPDKLNDLTNELLNINMFDQDGVVTEGFPELTPAQISGSLILNQFQDQVIGELQKLDKNNSLGPEILRKNEQGVQLAARLIEAFRKSGNPDDVKVAMQLEQEILSQILEQQFVIANQKAINAAEQIRITDPNTLSNNIFSMLEQVQNNARRQSKVLYEQVNLKTPVLDIEPITTAMNSANEKFSNIGFANVDQRLNRILRAMGVRVTGPEETSKALQKAQNKFDKLTSQEINEYNAFKERFFGVRGDGVNAIRQYVGDGFDMMDYGSQGGPSADKMVLELIEFRKRRGKQFRTDPLLKRLEKIANINIDIANAQKNIDIANQNFPDESSSQINANDLLNLRSDIIDEMEKFKQGPNRNRKQVEALATVLNGVDEALDLSLLGESQENLLDYQKAKTFTKAYNDAIVRTFANIVELKGHNDVSMMHPDLILDSVTQGKITPTMVRVNEIISAGNVVNDQLKKLAIEESLVVPRAGGLDNPSIEASGKVKRYEQVDPNTIVDTMDQVVKYASRQILDNVPDENGVIQKVVNPEKAQAFLNDDSNQVLFVAFPKLREMIEDGQSLRLSAIQAESVAHDQLLENRRKADDAVAMIFQNENPTQAITNAFESPDKPLENITQIIDFMNNSIERPEVIERLASMGKTPEDVKQGFRGAVIEYLVGGKGKIESITDFSQMRKTLNEPLLASPAQDRGPIFLQAQDVSQTFPASRITPSTKSVADILVEKNVFTRAEIDRMDYIFEVGENIQRAERGKGQSLEEISDNMLAFVSWLGAGSIGRFSENVPFLRPQGLVEAGIGARLARRLFSKGPINNQLLMLEKAVKDPSFLVQLLRKGKNDKEKLKNAKSLNAYLYGAGLTAQDDFEDIEEDDKVYMENRKFQQAPIKTRDMDVPLTAPDPFGRDREGLSSNVLQRILEQNADASMSSSPSTLRQPVLPNVPVPISARSAMAQAPSSPESRNRLASAFPSDGILGLMRT